MTDEPAPLQTLETRLIRIEGMVEEIGDRLYALADGFETRFDTLLKMLDEVVKR